MMMLKIVKNFYYYYYYGLSTKEIGIFLCSLLFAFNYE